MNNIIQSDLYRIRKGKAMRNALIGILGVIIVVGVMFMLMRGGVFQGIVENELTNAVLTEGERMSLEGDIMDMNSFMDMAPKTGADFTGAIMSENFLAVFLLVIVVAVVGADFNAGTFRNTLSYESDRKKVYLGRFVVNLLLFLMTLLVTVVSSMIVGGVLFGFGGFSAPFFGNLLVVLLLQLPIYLALLSFAQCIFSFAQKSAPAVAIYLLFVLFYSGIVQFIAMLLPTIKWILRLDFFSGIQLVAAYQTAPVADIAVPLIMAGCVLVASTVLGMVRYCKADMH